MKRGEEGMIISCENHRSTYLIDEQGLIQQAWPKVKPSENVQQILDYLDKQQTDI